jgi:hypothetical protein
VNQSVTGGRGPCGGKAESNRISRFFDFFLANSAGLVLFKKISRFIAGLVKFWTGPTYSQSPANVLNIEIIIIYGGSRFHPTANPLVVNRQFDARTPDPQMGFMQGVRLDEERNGQKKGKR